MSLSSCPDYLEKYMFGLNFLFFDFQILAGRPRPSPNLFQNYFRNLVKIYNYHNSYKV